MIEAGEEAGAFDLVVEDAVAVIEVGIEEVGGGVLCPVTAIDGGWKHGPERLEVLMRCISLDAAKETAMVSERAFRRDSGRCFGDLVAQVDEGFL